MYKDAESQVNTGGASSGTLSARLERLARELAEDSLYKEAYRERLMNEHGTDDPASEGCEPAEEYPEADNAALLTLAAELAEESAVRADAREQEYAATAEQPSISEKKTTRGTPSAENPKKSADAPREYAPPALVYIPVYPEEEYRAPAEYPIRPAEYEEQEGYPDDAEYDVAVDGGTLLNTEPQTDAYYEREVYGDCETDVQYAAPAEVSTVAYGDEGEEYSPRSEEPPYVSNEYYPNADSSAINYPAEAESDYEHRFDNTPYISNEYYPNADASAINYPAEAESDCEHRFDSTPYVSNEYYPNADASVVNYSADPEDYEYQDGADISYSHAHDGELDGDEPQYDAQFDNLGITRLEYPEFSDVEERPSAEEEIELDLVADKIDENAALVEMRMLYEIETQKREHKILGYKFTLNEGENYTARRRMEKRVNRLISKLAKAKRLERESSRRYYLAAHDRYLGDPARRERRAAEIESLTRRLDYLLEEREKLNERLVRLYTGASESAKKSTATYASKHSVRAAKRAYNAQKRAAHRLRRLHTPKELKEKIFSMMNERIDASARAEYLERRLKKEKNKGAARRGAIREIKQEKKRAAYAKADVRRFMKKAERKNAEYYENGRQLAWIFGTVAVIIIGILLYISNADAVNAFLASLFGS